MARRWTIIACLLVLAACSAPAADDDAVVQYGEPSGASTTSPAAAASGSGAGARGRGGPRTAESGSDVAVEDLQVDEREGGASPPTSAPSRLAERARGPVGSFASSLLMPSPATTI